MVRSAQWFSPAKIDTNDLRDSHTRRRLSVRLYVMHRDATTRVIKPSERQGWHKDQTPQDRLRVARAHTKRKNQQWSGVVAPHYFYSQMQ